MESDLAASSPIQFSVTESGERHQILLKLFTGPAADATAFTAKSGGSLSTVSQFHVQIARNTQTDQFRPS